MAESETSSLAGRVAFTYPGFALFLTARWFIIASLEMQSVAVGWQIYQITRSPLSLGLIGLAQFLPEFSYSWYPGTPRIDSPEEKSCSDVTQALPFAPLSCS